MSRSADYTIKGFLYQFNKTLLEILNSQDDGIVSVEGIIEDVEITTPSGLTAIQCKYHEASKKFTQSDIFEPILQMMHHFYTNQSSDICYVLFAHYPSENETLAVKDEKDILKAALESKNRTLERYVMELHDRVNIDQFSGKFAIEFGPPFDNLVSQVCAALQEGGIPEGDIETLAYPNAINMIAQISVKHDPEERRITRQQFLTQLKDIRKTAISRWTMALRTRKQLLDARRKQLKTHLDKNSRLRYIVVNAQSLDDFDAEIVLFVSDYLDKYHFKVAHISTPLLCIRSSEDTFRDVQYRLFKKGIISEDGHIGKHFDESRFFREPLSRKSAGSMITREFSLRLLRWEKHSAVLDSRKCDDLFVIGMPDCVSMDTVDVNVEYLAAATLKEIKYLMGVSNVYE